jgi:hypothetical protein
MKKLILAAITTACAASVFAQGTVVFNNRIGGTTHVYSGGTSQIQGNSPQDNPAGSTDWATGGAYHLIGTVGGLAASSTFAQLLGGPAGSTEASLLPGLPTTTFRTGGASGNVSPTTATFANIPKDAASANFEMVAWDNSSGLYPTWAQASVAWNASLIQAGRSAMFTLNSIGGDVNLPPNIIPGLTSFNIFFVPEPTTAALLGLGAAGMLIFRRRK